ncbi:uncharacterized protein LOC119628419 isoform X2 [Bombyx mori]|uniref:Uncharacterized protein n=1 Tax=Bombyx mori TaxID=7091 RepID=A0A8R2M8E2_BOMMO|nr:uncharacterized protein LOC119628419 isoform X2 [Bombyx mori]
MRSTRKGKKVQAYNTRRNKTNGGNVSNYEENIDKILPCLKERIKIQRIFKEQFAKKDSPESCVNTEEDQRTSFNVPESDDDADFCDSSDNLYVPETTDESDNDSDICDVTSATSNSKQNHQVSFEIHDEATENKQTECLSTEEKEGDKKKRIRQRDYCFYCESLILNFARHVIRNHSNEPEVQKVLSMPKNTKSRKQMLTLLRKKGNYITNTQNSTLKPMKKNKYNRSDDYLPCTKCLGFYSRKQLWKHKKLCDSNNLTSNVQVDAQNFLVRNIKVNQKLKDDVFPRMRPDKISMFAKKDSLICAFGLQYLRTHREKHFITVTSRKMRELGKLLIEIKKIKPNISSLLDALKPENYGTLVLATKNAASFNNLKDRYDSPTYAMNIATSLKQCCNIALLESYKAEAGINRTEIQIDLKTLTSIIQSNWKFDVSSQAADDLNIKRYNKTTIVPLASDLKCLKDYLNKTAAHAVVKLSESNNSLNCNAFNALIECVFCRLLLLNRRRPGELQRLQLSFYENYDKKDNENNKYEEFDKALSATEKILVNSLKRIVIRGKRGRGVPVLFSKDVQKDIDILISLRHKYVNTDNDFLFSKAGGSVICGYRTIEKYAKACGAKNPKALTSTRLRKHLATLTQLFNMSENDMEQLASFMGHTMSIHKQNYRLPDDVFQTAKISKLLLLMETGNADMYKGHTLDEININLEEEIIGDDIQNEEILDYEMLEPTPPVNKTSLNSIDSSKQSIPFCSNNESVEQKVIKKKRVLVPWTPQQKRVVLNFFSKHIKSRKPPKRDECENLRSQYPELLNNKDWLKIKVFIQNTYTKQ